MNLDGLTPEEGELLGEYVDLRIKYNSVGHEGLSDGTLRRMASVRQQLGDALIEQRVTRHDVNGRIFD